MNLPNKLTLMRIILVPFTIVAILIEFPCHYLVALAFFGAASLTDMFDGKIARSRNLVTNFGKFCDPLADKILVISVLLCFLQCGLCDCVLIIVVLFREFAVSSVRLLAATEGKVVAANIWGKVKTVTQIIAIILIFVLQFTIELMSLVSLDSATINLIGTVFFWVGESALWVSTLFCIISGIIYMIDNKQFISME
jgi:CDP-diacylglycerol--glycerol-3-phosphate 3-phosphatidyltransferase